MGRGYALGGTGSDRDSLHERGQGRGSASALTPTSSFAASTSMPAGLMEAPNEDPVLRRRRHLVHRVLKGRDRSG
jgi:hypothetical protein